MKTPLKVGTSDPKVGELEQKLIKAGYLEAEEASVANGPENTYPENTYTKNIEAAVKAFQSKRALHIDGICGTQTWIALEEAQWKLGDRDIFLTSPMMRGDDVGSLQKILGQLGFSADREDSIFGPNTETALYEFQNNNGLSPDKTCGAQTLQILNQISRRAKGESVASVKDRERLRSTNPALLKRIFIGDLSELSTGAPLAETIAAQLENFEVCMLQNSNPSTLAQESRSFEADVFLALKISETSEFHSDYFATDSYESAGGKYLANLLTASIPPILFGTDYEEVEPRGRRIQILQETRMWTVLCTLGSEDLVNTKNELLGKTFAEVLKLWLKNT